MARTKDQWTILPRVCYYGQPIGLGLLLAIPGGFLSVMMLLAFDLKEHWTLILATMAMGIASFAMFCAGMSHLLAPFQQVWISREEIQRRMFGLVLQRIPTERIRSVTAKPRTIIIRNKDFILHRLTIHCKGHWTRERGFWLDWSPDTDAAMKEMLGSQVNLLF